MVDQKTYNVLVKAFELACDMLSKSNLEVTDGNIDILEHKLHGTLKGYFLLKATEIVIKN